jgi:hypothetical protein
MTFGSVASTSSKSRRCMRNMVRAIIPIDQLHQLTATKGPIVRVNPEELSISDPDFYNELYVTESKRRTNSYDVFCKGIDFDGRLLMSHLVDYLTNSTTKDRIFLRKSMTSIGDAESLWSRSSPAWGFKNSNPCLQTLRSDWRSDC